MTKIKICGITNIEDALTAAGHGADALGFIFYNKSPRYVDPEKAADIVRSVPPFVKKVGVFVNEEMNVVKEILGKVELDMMQFSGDETPDYCNSSPKPYIKAIRVRDSESLGEIDNFKTPYLLLDSYSEKQYGGTGKSFDWDLIEKKHLGDKYVILSGGLNPGNIGDAILKIKPYAVDVASGVEESPGRKDHNKIKQFIEAVKNAG